MEGQAPRAPTSPPHGVKRRAEDDPRDEQRLAKRFDLLNLDHSGKLYVPVPQYAPSTNHAPDNDSMHLDNTKTKVYIYNLDEEIATIDSDEKSMVFLPDIEKKIGKVPQYVLTGDLQPTAQNQMVLYGVPSSLTVPEDQDSVRRAIMESRERAREKQLEGLGPANIHQPASNPREVLPSTHETQDFDAMDLG